MRKEISRAVYLRSFLCILVVVGHVVGRWKMTDKFFIPVNESQIFPYISEFINSFHMSLFFALSGFLYCYQAHENKKYDNFFKFGLNKFKRLIVPLLMTAVLFAPVVLFTTRKEDSLFLILQNIIVGTQGYHLWYLPALFHVFIFIMICGRFFTRERKLLNICVIVISFIISCYYYIIPFHFYIKDAAIYLFFFLAGYYAKLYWDSMRKIFCRHYVWAIVAVILAFAIGNFSTYLILVKRIKACVIDYLLVNVILCLDFSGGGIKKLLSFIDKNSMAIYLYHPIFMYLFFYYFIELDCAPIVLALCTITVCMGGSIGIAVLFRRIGIQWVMGERMARKN